jgi:hypothetical protein
LHGKNLEPAAALCHAYLRKNRRACLVVLMSDNLRLSQGQPALCTVADELGYTSGMAGCLVRSKRPSWKCTM